ncbi:MAG: outer membrane lipoprotein carrier protein LolA [Rhodospirillales bacterium]|nr:outer membrane lipoprotein carrier protein LolA [Rhodospirillales bacterium]
MTLTRRTFGLSSAAAALLPVVAHALIEDRAVVIAQVENYLNGITTMDSHFVQLNPDGTSSSGTFQMKRPHFARIAYDEPETVLIARGQKYLFWDAEIGQFYEGPVSASPASVLLHPDIKLEEAANVVDIRRDKDYLMITLVPSDEPGAGLLTLAFEEDPMNLRHWFVRDAQSHVTRVTLVDIIYGTDLDDALFDLDHRDIIRPD